MSRSARRLACLTVVLTAARLAAQAPFDGPGFEHVEVAPGVHAFVFDNPLSGGANVDGTAVAIINDDDVVVVDAQWTPATSRRVLAEIRKLTPKPVRYVINTHWHGDHWFGNQTYRDAFPGVEFVAHPRTLRDIDDEELPDIDTTRSIDVPQMIASAEGLLQGGRNADGSVLAAADSARMLRYIEMLNWSRRALMEITPVRPTVLVADSLVLLRGERRIVIRYLGRGNTRGDLSVWLPTERVLITGDLLVGPAPYAFGSYPTEWREVLGKLRTLPAAVIVPGHGPVQRDWAYLDLVREALEAVTTQVRAAVDRGLDLEATRKAVDLGALRERFAKGDARVGRGFDGFFVAPIVERAWREARGEIEDHPRGNEE